MTSRINPLFARLAGLVMAASVTLAMLMSVTSIAQHEDAGYDAGSVMAQSKAASAPRS